MAQQNLHYFLNNMNIDAINSCPDHQTLANNARRNNRRVYITGRSVLRQNIEREVIRLQQPYDRFTINVITRRIWNNFTNSRRQQFSDSARAANRINQVIINRRMNRNTGFINRMFQIHLPQQTNTDFERDLFYGTGFP